MFKLSFTKQEIEDIKNKVYLSEMQERILEYRLKEYSRIQMADKEKTSVATIDREIKKLVNKIKKVL